MSALAVYAKQLAIKVTGSDVEEEFVTDKILKKAGIVCFKGFNARHLKARPDKVIISAAYGEENPEVRTVINRDLPAMAYSELLGFFMELARQNHQAKGIAVAGIHGKTTTTAWLAHTLKNLGQDPSYIIGSGEVGGLGLNAHAGKGRFFVCEADEYKKARRNDAPKFLDLSPDAIIISSIEMDHPDMFNTIDEIYNAFYRFACRVPRSGFIAANYDYPKVQKLTKTLVDRRFETYGWHPDSRWRIIAKTRSFHLLRGQEKFGPFAIDLPGKHNILNAASVIVTCLNFGFEAKKIVQAITGFQGVERRFQFMGKYNKVEFYDDYAHHPTAIRFTLEALKQKFPKKERWVIFQPHTYSRTQALFNEFAKSFTDANRVIVADIFGSAREKKGNINSFSLAKEISRYHPKVEYIPSIQEITELVKKELKGKEAIVMTIGAGDIYKIGKEIISK